MSATIPDFTPQARQIATCVYRYQSTHRGVRILKSGERGLPGSCWLAVYGNDGYSQDWRTRLEVALVRSVLATFDAEEYGFGVDEIEGYSWVLLVGRVVTPPIRHVIASQKRTLRARLDEVVRWAWSTAAGSAFALRKSRFELGLKR